jgi:predicted AAA+ superfamily ATPase
MQPLNLKTTLRRLSETSYEIDFVHANKELLHLPSYGANEFSITRDAERLRDGLRVRTIQRYVDIFSESVLSEMVSRTNTELGGQLYEAGVIVE